MAETSCDVKRWGKPDVYAANRRAKPRIIWSYWHDPEIPEIVRLCVRSWERHAPGYVIRLLTRETVRAYTGRIPFWVAMRKPAAISDWIRLKLLRDHGGVWMDASLFLLTDLEEAIPAVAFADGPPFVFFNRNWTTDPGHPMAENWFIAAGPRDPMIAAWYRHYTLACINRHKYTRLQARRLGMDNLFQGFTRITYFTVYAMFQVAIRRRPQAISFSYMDSECGPFALQARLDYDRDAIARVVVDGGDMSGISAIKLINDERGRVVARMAQSGIRPGSILRTFAD